METRSAKRKKLLESENESSGQDRLTDLPDSIIHHILFRLPIKFIAQTSVLSKRWTHIWYTFPDLDFTTLVNNSQDFINNVLSIRYKHVSCSDIRILRLGARFTFSQLHCLLRSAVRHNVQQLDMEVFTDDCFNLPRSILNCDSLTILKVKSIGPGFRLPPLSILKDGFQSVHTLCLSYVILYQQPKVVLDSSSFPQLKELNLDQCRGLMHLSIYCRGLVKFTLDRCFQLDNLDIGCSKLETIMVSRCFNTGSGSWVKINAPKLEKLVWTENVITDQSSVDNLSSLHEASVGFVGMTAAKVPSLCDFLSGLSRSRCLTLERPCVEILWKYKQIAGFILEPFVNLKSLELHTTNTQGLANLFRAQLALHKLVIKKFNKQKLQTSFYSDLSSSFDGEQYWDSQTQDFKQFFQKLKIVTVHGMSECEDEVSLVKFLLGHATALQEMAISCMGQQSKFKGRIRLERIKSKVMRFSRASSDAKLVFY